MKVLLFAGAGTSIELGVPGMGGLAEEFVDHVRQWDLEPDIVSAILGDTRDVEHLIEELDRICTARPSLGSLGLDTVPLDRVDKIRAEVEWFVQHAAERVVARRAGAMWGAVLRSSALVDLTLVTTNYDRAIELAANAVGVRLDDGFGLFGPEETAAWVNFDMDAHHPRLVKLHGSTDWYSEGALSSPTKLRHPMPLFGRAALRLAGGRELGSALVLPSREKLLTRAPYPRLSQAFLNASDACDIAIFVGSSMRDQHIRDAARMTAERVPVFTVNPSGESFGISGALPIAECASTFLVGTLPNALISPDPVAALKLSAERVNGGSGILDAVCEAIDVDASPALRCGALEELDTAGVTLDLFLLRQVLGGDDTMVAQYALGLISLSAARDILIDEVAALPHANNPAFREDLRLLKDLVAQSAAFTDA